MLNENWLTNSFPKRNHYHDQIALPAAKAAFEPYGLIGHTIGTEIDYDLLRRELRANLDLTSLKFRYRPDLLLTSSNSKVPALLAEIKCELGRYSNWSIEFLSFIAAQEWDYERRNVIYVFAEIDPTTERIVELKSCWHGNIPFPREVLLPRAYDYDQKFSYIKTHYPGTFPRPINSTNGSGTPYFLVSKKSGFIKPFDVFMNDTFGFEVESIKEFEQLSFL